MHVCTKSSFLLERSLPQTKQIKLLDWTTLGFLEALQARAVCVPRQIFMHTAVRDIA